ncbi:hypothetical protein EBT31_03225 [bacterium]|nr:hypothetical protein [bacterium]NBX50924.1 hypothetical protein [bacterium]
MADSGAVIVKAGLDIPGSCPLLQNFLDFVWDQLNAQAGSQTYMNIPANAKYLDVSLDFQWSDTPVNTCRVMYTHTNGSHLQYDLFLFPLHSPSLNINNLAQTYPIANHCNISAIKVGSSPVMDMILSYQDHLYVAYKLNVVIHQAGALYMTSQRPREREFFQRYWCRYTNMTIRFGVRSGYDIPWHKDSGEVQYQGVEGQMFGAEQKAGFITCGIYTNRPQGLPNDEGGISFTKDRGVFSLFPKGGTCVTFLDPEVFHRVIPVRGGGTAEKRQEFVKRSAVFMEHFTNKQRVEQNLPMVQPIFAKPSLPYMIRNAQGAFKFLNKYFETNFKRGLEEHGLDPTNIRGSILAAPDAVINKAYGYMPEGYPAYVQSIHQGYPLRPLPEFFIFKVRGTNGNSKRQRLLNLYNLYTLTLSNLNTGPEGINNNLRNLGWTNEEIANRHRPRYHPPANANELNASDPRLINHQGLRFTRNFMRGNLNEAGV